MTDTSTNVFSDYSADFIMSCCDHTNLRPEAVWDDIKALCDEAIDAGCASVCIQPSYVQRAKAYAGDRIKICTVIGFPCGYNTTESKAFETQNAVACGADEIDMVINIGMLKDKQYDALSDEIAKIRKICEGKILKVIIETCLLDRDEIIKISEIISSSGADYIKTSTGFSTSGADAGDVALMKKHCPACKVKAAGGIRSPESAVQMLEAGASRIGESALLSALTGGSSK